MAPLVLKVSGSSLKGFIKTISSFGKCVSVRELQAAEQRDSFVEKFIVLGKIHGFIDPVCDPSSKIKQTSQIFYLETCGPQLTDKLDCRVLFVGDIVLRFVDHDLNKGDYVALFNPIVTLTPCGVTLTIGPSKPDPTVWYFSQAVPDNATMAKTSIAKKCTKPSSKDSGSTSSILLDSDSSLEIPSKARYCFKKCKSRKGGNVAKMRASNVELGDEDSDSSYTLTTSPEVSGVAKMRAESWELDSSDEESPKVSNVAKMRAKQSGRKDSDSSEEISPRLPSQRKKMKKTKRLKLDYAHSDHSDSSSPPRRVNSHRRQRLSKSKCSQGSACHVLDPAEGRSDNRSHSEANSTPQSQRNSEKTKIDKPKCTTVPADPVASSSTECRQSDEACCCRQLLERVSLLIGCCTHNSACERNRTVLQLLRVVSMSEERHNFCESQLPPESEAHFQSLQEDFGTSHHFQSNCAPFQNQSDHKETLILHNNVFVKQEQISVKEEFEVKTEVKVNVKEESPVKIELSEFKMEFKSEPDDQAEEEMEDVSQNEESDEETISNANQKVAKMNERKRKIDDNDPEKRDEQVTKKSKEDENAENEPDTENEDENAKTNESDSEKKEEDQENSKADAPNTRSRTKLTSNLVKPFSLPKGKKMLFNPNRFNNN